jgi:hypothetical protein
MFTPQETFNIYSLVIADKVGIQINALQVLYNNTGTFITEYLQTETQKQVNEINSIGVANIPEVDLRDMLQEISDYYGLTHESQEILSRYMIVATFSFYEKGIKRMLQLSNKFTDPELRNCFKKNELVKLLNAKFGIDYNSLADSNLIEELRCLNNDIKHNGQVGQELVDSNNKWVLNEEIGNTYPDFVRMMAAPRNLLKDLSGKIKPHIS